MWNYLFSATAIGHVIRLASSHSANALEIQNSGGSVLSAFNASGSLGLNIGTPTAALDINSDTMRLRTARTPASATATGNAGDICWDNGYVYVCVATNTWKRAQLLTW